MSYRNLLEETAKGLPLSSYLLASSDPFLHSEAVSLIKDLVPAHERDFNFQMFDLLNSNNMPFDRIIDVLNTMPFFSGRKFVLVENSQKISKKDLKKLGRYLSIPSESSVLILLYAGSCKKDIKDELKGIKQIILDIGEREIPSWLKVKAGSKGLELTEDAADYLLGTIGPDLGLLSSELEKCTLIGKPKIGKEDIVEITEGKRTYNAFALIDAIRAKDTGRVFRIYRILRDTEEPYSLLGVLNWQFGKYFAEKNTPRDRVYYLRVFELLNKADVAIKSSGSFYPLELLLVKLLRLSRQR